MNLCPLHIDYALPCLYCRKVAEEIARWKKGVGWFAAATTLHEGEPPQRASKGTKREINYENKMAEMRRKFCYRILNAVGSVSMRQYRCKLAPSHEGDCYNSKVAQSQAKLARPRNPPGRPRNDGRPAGSVLENVGGE